MARSDSGTIQIGGIDCTANPKAAQQLVGVVPDESNLYPELTGFDNLCFCAVLYGMGKAKRQARARELLEMFDLAKAANRRFGGYSKGMKRKLTIAAGIIHKPEILFLDEPTTGIDVASARSEEIFKWLVASLLLRASGGRNEAVGLYGELERLGVMTARELSERDPRISTSILLSGSGENRGAEVLQETSRATFVREYPRVVPFEQRA